MNILRVNCQPLSDLILQTLEDEFGPNIHIHDVDIHYGDNPGQDILDYLEHHPEFGTIDIFEVDGDDDEQLIQIAYELDGQHISEGLIKAVYRLNPNTGMPSVVDEDELGRDVYDFQGYVSLHYRTVRHLMTSPL